MLPKATGREAQMEKKAVRRQEAKDRDDDGVMTTMYGGGDVMGGDDSFAAAKRRVEAAGQRRNQKTNVRREQVSASREMRLEVVPQRYPSDSHQANLCCTRKPRSSLKPYVHL
jgi:hypothetical protein